jgi:hypothetical protein
LFLIKYLVLKLFYWTPWFSFSLFFKFLFFYYSYVHTMLGSSKEVPLRSM